MSHVHTTTSDGVATVTIDSPPLNILTRSVMADTREQLSRLAGHDTLRVLVLGASGKHFSAGADVGEHLPGRFESMIAEFVETVNMIRTFPIPVVAQVRGKCLGGGFELVMAADLIMASDTAVFGQPEILLGVFPPAACAFLPRLMPPGAARYLVLSGEAVSAEEAQNLGLVYRVVPDAELEHRTNEAARAIARNSAAALRITKRALLAAETGSPGDALANAAELYVNELMNTEDAVRGLQAFIEKQQPEWRHR